MGCDAGVLATQGAYRLWTMGVLPDEVWESALVSLQASPDKISVTRLAFSRAYRRRCTPVSDSELPHQIKK
jgi:hypothetical protein